MNRFVEPVAVGALHDQKIHVNLLTVKLQGGILEERFAEAAQVAGVADPGSPPVFP